MKIYIHLLLTAMLFGSVLGAAPKNRMTICHFDDESDTWIEASLPLAAAKAHLAKHDDAPAGGVTSITNTPVDEYCVPLDLPQRSR